jgi:hypothetical protein
MTHANHLSLAELEKRRAEAIRKGQFDSILCSVTDPDTRAGLVIGRSSYGRAQISAYFFRPTQINRSFKKVALDSAHDQFGALDLLKDSLAEEKRLKSAAHTLEIGDVIAAVWGVTMRGVHFYQVVGIPHPRKVTLVPLKSTMISGDWMAGQEMPVLPDSGLASGEGADYMVSMESGSPMVNMRSSITYARKWDGNPIHTYSD